MRKAYICFSCDILNLSILDTEVDNTITKGFSSAFLRKRQLKSKFKINIFIRNNQRESLTCTQVNSHKLLGKSGEISAYCPIAYAFSHLGKSLFTEGVRQKNGKHVGMDKMTHIDLVVCVHDIPFFPV